MDLQLVPADPPTSLGLQVLEEVAGLEVAEQRGTVVITGVSRGSRAEQMGLRPGDLVVGANGRDVRSLRELNDILMRGVERSSIVLAIARGRYVYTLTFPMSGTSL